MDNNESPRPEIVSVLMDTVRQELHNTHKVLIALIIVCAVLVASVTANVFLIMERLQYEVVYEETSDGYEIDVDGNGNNFVGGNQYNDNAVHKDEKAAA